VLIEIQKSVHKQINIIFPEMDNTS